jgi:murein endopeptidase
MLEVQAKDSRGYFMLPQRPEGAGYYVYGTPTNGGGQYAHPALLTVLFWVERAWQTSDRRRFGVGNISLADGGEYKKHKSHVDGLQVDVRAIRLDGAQDRVTRFQRDLYDKKATARLIGIFLSHPLVKTVLFNDVDIPGVRPWEGHDDHFHVDIRVPAK